MSYLVLARDSAVFNSLTQNMLTKRRSFGFWRAF
jgi:hypothetical protein